MEAVGCDTCASRPPQTQLDEHTLPIRLVNESSVSTNHLFRYALSRDTWHSGACQASGAKRCTTEGLSVYSV
eukprot:3172349-Amphidinium_carterae.1